MAALEITGHEAAGTLLGHIEEGEILAGWEIIATGDGGAIAMKSGSCWSRHCGEFDSETGWNAATARLWARTTTEELAERIAEYQGQLRGAKGASREGIKAALWACIGEQMARKARAEA